MRFIYYYALVVRLYIIIAAVDLGPFVLYAYISVAVVIYYVRNIIRDSWGLRRDRTAIIEYDIISIFANSNGPRKILLILRWATIYYYVLKVEI